MPHINTHGFSLVEFLITLVLLGVVVTFTIPKLLQTSYSTLNGKQTVMARDVAFMVLAAYEQYRMGKPSVPTTLKPADLTPYMNYISIDTASTYDGMKGENDQICNAANPCLILHNGGKLQLKGSPFNGNSSLNAIMVQFDPDGTANETTTDGPGSSLKIALYYSGKILPRGTIYSNTISGSNTYGPCDCDPSWFSNF